MFGHSKLGEKDDKQPADSINFFDETTDDLVEDSGVWTRIHLHR